MVKDQRRYKDGWMNGRTGAVSWLTVVMPSGQTGATIFTKKLKLCIGNEISIHVNKIELEKMENNKDKKERETPF